MGAKAVAWLMALSALALGVAIWQQRERPPVPTKASPSGDAGLFREALPASLRNIVLGMPASALRTQRPRAQPSSAISEPGMFAYEETLAPSEQAIFFFDDATRKLARLQAAARLAGVESIEPRLRALERALGPASGVWNCPSTSGLPTRRFSWFRGDWGLMDAYLIAGEQVAATRYVAPRAALQASLATQRCAAVPPGALRHFPVAAPARAPN